MSRIIKYNVSQDWNLNLVPLFRVTPKTVRFLCHCLDILSIQKEEKNNSVSPFKLTHLSHQSFHVAITCSTSLWQCHISLCLVVMMKGSSAVPPFPLYESLLCMQEIKNACSRLDQLKLSFQAPAECALTFLVYLLFSSVTQGREYEWKGYPVRTKTRRGH